MASFTGQDLVCIRGERLVFAKLDFTLESGGCLTLIGHNGAGKSSLLRMMAGLLSPASGVMSWEGEPVSQDMDEHRERLHYVGHHDAIKPVLSVEENLKFWAGLRSDASKAQANFKEALDIFSIGHLIDVPGRFLSAGQKRRANLARIIASKSPLWLLDEPTTALDKESIKKLEDVIEAHREKGGMVVLSTHSDMNIKDQQVLNVGDFTAARGHESASLLAEGI
ncbi:Cytochrome c biogenesis ATP-binding export protein CcmA [Candidatus Terasakiella magnetica]|uniref:Cytochrome c biogenesis ATP-binding export protein CcmA n=1 Tax=Candidatus Terasakiella magnetica TaxID=1867952 RepID=A0A1C3RIM7_9PROT|nr:heme ABC exporter ATP-binding protein CcmA [Candidatus Terasakiella magnetica]SCA57125.1 Cytochrome c biogenesis ATP-binding export protein CcmA [Candidatus Terasakiella magnetica]